jgi:DNA transposition AAA+ family ATPase
MQNTSENLSRLRSFARDALIYQTERGWSDSVICREIANLGSTKTYKRILDVKDDLEGLKIDRQLSHYEAAAEVIRHLRDRDKLAEPEYENFSNITESEAAVIEAMGEDTIARFVCIEGESGTGKDAVKNHLLKIYKNAIVSLNADSFWETNLASPTADIYQALNIRRRDDDGPSEPMPRDARARWQLIAEELRARKLTLIINEGHHCGRKALDLIKMIINETPTVVVLFCIPELLRKILRSEFATANQLFTNRLCRRLQLKTPIPEEISEMMSNRGVKWVNAAHENDASKALAKDAPGLGNWRFIVLVTRTLAAASRKAPLDLAKFETLRDEVQKRRVVKQQVGRLG